MYQSSEAQFFQIFCSRVADNPSKTAIIHGDEEISFGRLFEKCCEFAELWELQEDMLVALELPKGIDFIAGILACWSKGASYVPLAYDDSSLRKNNLAYSAGINLWVTKQEVRRLQPYCYFSDLAYVIFTSGSSGAPKAVAVSHAGIVEVIEAQIRSFAIDSTSRVLWMLSTLFDASLSDIGTALLSGATLVIPASVLSAHELPLFLTENKVTHADIPPGYLRHLKAESLGGLATLIIGGEIPPQNVIDFARFMRVINVYGPTEATICTSCKVVDDSFHVENIGQPLPGVSYRLCPVEAPGPAVEVPNGNPGELWIGGSHVARGYLNQEALTKERFVDGWYRTGDICLQNCEGDFIYKGRLDRQIKLNGKLVAPEEVEAVLSHITGVDRVYVCEPEKGILASAYQGNAEVEDILEEATRRLPSWMIPTRWRRFEKLPLTSSGKIDAKRIDWTGSTKGNTTQTGHLQLICSQVLGYSVDMSLSLAENGGDSLIAMEIAALTAQDGLPVAPETLLSAKRLAEISGNDQMHATLLRELADRVKLPNGSKVVRPLQKVFLIGATGFLGRQVLAALQEKFEVIALVRSGACDLKNCEVVIGDITRPKFGLSRADYARALECTDIVNCSGVVNLACDLQQHLPVNFYALQNVLEFQAVGGLGLHQISTLSVFVHTDYIPDNCSTSDPLDSAKIVYGGYAQSKFAADILMQRAEKDRHVHLIRPGLITPHRDKPEWGKNDLLRKFIKGIIELGAVPALADVRFDVTPVDWLAGEIANGVICRTSRT